jgi:hypothetical protein
LSLSLGSMVQGNIKHLPAGAGTGKVAGLPCPGRRSRRGDGPRLALGVSVGDLGRSHRLADHLAEIVGEVGPQGATRIAPPLPIEPLPP